MQKNVGSIDRTIRIVLGIVFLVAGLISQASAGVKTALFAVGAIALATAFISF